MHNPTPLLTLHTANNRTRAHLRDILAQILRVDRRVAESSADNVLRHGPEAGQDVERAAVVAVERADKECGVAV